MAHYDELNGQAAVLTGASRGIGEAAAYALAAEGVAVVLAARSEDNLSRIAKTIRDGGGKAETVRCDVSRYEDVAAAVERCQSAFGRLDILLNNAGVIDPISRLTESEPDAWDKVIDINVKGVYYGMRAAGPIMEAAGRGVIINISSGAATAANQSTGNTSLASIDGKLPALDSSKVSVIPSMTSGGNTSVQTNATGANWTAFM